MEALAKIFQYRNQAVRTVQINGESWFAAADVCAILGLANTSQAISYLEDDERCLITNEVWRNNGEMQAVSEPGLYSLVLRSRKPEARNFRRWITHEVIPALRQSGGYFLSGAAAETGALLQFSRRDLLRLAVDAEAECEQLRQNVVELAPKADFYNRVADTSSTFSFGEVAKMLDIPGCGRNNLVKFLREDGILMSDNVAKQRYVDRGYFQVVQAEYFAPDGSPRVKAVTRVREKGVDFVRRRLETYLRQYMERKLAGM